MAKEKTYCLYVLVSCDTPVYVGVTSRLENRISAHRLSGKVFTGYFVIEKFTDKRRALDSEAAIIKYLSAFGNFENVNAKYVSISHRRMYSKKSF